MGDSDNRVDAESVKSLAVLLQETGLTEIEYQIDTLRIRVTRQMQIPTNVVFSADHNISSEPNSVTQTDHLQQTNLKQTEESPFIPAEENSGEIIKSPMVGVVYLASAPGAEPFVNLGDSVAEGQTLLLIEAMKVMNLIKSPHAGTIKKILVKDRQPVEYDEPLVIIE